MNLYKLRFCRRASVWMHRKTAAAFSSRDGWTFADCEESSWNSCQGCFEWFASDNYSEKDLLMDCSDGTFTNSTVFVFAKISVWGRRPMILPDARTAQQSCSFVWPQGSKESPLDPLWRHVVCRTVAAPATWGLLPHARPQGL